MFIHYLEHHVREQLPFPLYDGARAVRVVDAERCEHTVHVAPFSAAARSAKRVNVLYDQMRREGQVAQRRVGNTPLSLIHARDALDTTRSMAAEGRFFYDLDRPSGGPAPLSWKRRWVNSQRYLSMPLAAKRERLRDRVGVFGLSRDPGIERSVALAIEWLGRAQDESKHRDGGFSHSYSLVEGWAPSYPETSGYIVPTLLDWAAANDDDEARARALRCLDWLVSIQLDNGAFQGGVVDVPQKVPVTFNTGQILLGLAAGAAEFGEAYREPMRRAAEWLVETQDSDGCWRHFASPFAHPGENAYETHVAWGLLEAARVEGDSERGRAYASAGLANVHWALGHQRANGWFDNCCLSDPLRPLTHTLGYVLRGVLEAYRFEPDPQFLRAAIATAQGLEGLVDNRGRLPGRVHADWSGAVDWVCLTGSVQAAHCWLMLFEQTGQSRYLSAARSANAFVRRTMDMSGPENRRGGIKGSFPVSGGYMAYRYPNWAAKFFIDANLLETRIGKSQPTP